MAARAGGHMAEDQLTQLGLEAQALAASLSAAGRRKLAAELARTLRATQAERIRANLQPDGTPMAPRKPRQAIKGRRGALRRKMFGKLISARWLKATASPNEVNLAFVGSANRLATTHHFGLRERIKGQTIQYPARELLGLAKGDLDRIEQAMLDHLTK